MGDLAHGRPVVSLFQEQLVGSLHDGVARAPAFVQSVFMHASLLFYVNERSFSS
jgi:hypothetical protein